MSETESAKPTIVCFFGIPMKAVCGKCGGTMILTDMGDRAASMNEFLKNTDRCPLCGYLIDADGTGYGERREADEKLGVRE